MELFISSSFFIHQEKWDIQMSNIISTDIMGVIPCYLNDSDKLKIVFCILKLNVYAYILKYEGIFQFKNND